ncbi:MAG: archaeosortase/exosortase family protein, partial [bacterium]
MNRTQKIVFAAVVSLFLVWFVFHFSRLLADADGAVSTEREVCVVLGLVFSLAILLRNRGISSLGPAPLWGWTVSAAGIVGLAASVVGIVFDIRQLDWLGILLLMYAGLRWSLPSGYSRSIPPALLLLYWIHPVPFSVFGPLQLAMQNASVLGAEWLSHCLNIAAWADGTVLLTETCTLDVPQACSGMTTAVAVFVSCLGTGLLFRIRWYAISGLILFGLFQVLILNILRIALMAFIAPHMPPEWVAGFLHDSLGLLLILGIVIVQVETAILLARQARKLKLQTAIEKGIAEPEDRSSAIHPFWRRLSRNAWIILIVLFVSATVAGALYKRRPAHRSRMVYRLVDNLAISNIAGAERAALAAVRMDGSNLTARHSLAQILVYRRKYDQAMAELGKIPADQRGVPVTVIRAQALAGKRQLVEALALINSMDENARRQPPVAMVRAEIASEQNDIKCVASNVVLAATSSSPALLKRVRALFPYLASKEEWRTIIKCDRPFPYADPIQASIAVDAYLRVHDVSGMARTLSRAVKTWPEEPAFLTHLLAMAVLRPEGEWETLFVKNFLRNLPQLDNDRLAACLQHCFRLNRPDLAWLACHRLAAIDPRDPTLYLTVSQFADRWFTFRMNHLGMSAPHPSDTANLKQLCRNTRNVWPLSLIWDKVPLEDETTSDSAENTSRKYLQSCIEELERRENASGLNLRNQMMFVTALTRAGRFAEASQRLDKFDMAYPERKLDVINKRLLLADLNRDWGSSYELSRESIALSQHPGISVSLSRMNALVHLQLGAHALAIGEKMHGLFPDSVPVTLAYSSILSAYGFEEEALFIVSRSPEVAETPAGAILLYDTERFFEADRFAMATGKTGQRRAERSQNLLMPAAELTIMLPQPGNAPQPAAVAKLVSQFESEARTAGSPYVRDLKSLIANWHRTGGTTASSDPARWETVGRDDTEKAFALFELAALLLWQKRIGEADVILERATTLQPDASVLWQFRVAASSGRSNVVEQAGLACPSSPEIWLAHIVAKTRDAGRGEWALREIRQAVDQQRFSAGTLVRAGEFLLRHGMPDAAALAARYSIKHANGLLPAYVLGLRCASTMGDMDWALLCANQAAGNSLDPIPFEKTIADIRLLQGSRAPDLAAVLNKLRLRFPNEVRWPERLSALHFQRGDMRGVSGMFEFMERNNLVDQIQAPSLIMAAEAARLEGRDSEAVRILEGAYERFPDNNDVLNNYVFTLAQTTATVARAQALLSKLLARSEPSSAVYDTAAVVHLRAGNLELASDYSAKAIRFIQPQDYAADEVYLNAAETHIRLGQHEKARGELALARQNAKRSLAVDNRRRNLLSALDKESRALRQNKMLPKQTNSSMW